MFARIGASDNLVQYQSTFMSEMLETAFILAQATDKSLVVVDEIGKRKTLSPCYVKRSFARVTLQYLFPVTWKRTHIFVSILANRCKQIGTRERAMKTRNMSLKLLLVLVAFLTKWREIFGLITDAALLLLHGKWNHV